MTAVVEKYIKAIVIFTSLDVFWQVTNIREELWRCGRVFPRHGILFLIGFITIFSEKTEIEENP